MNWHKQHKWSGIAAAILLLMIGISGIILNHRDAVSDMDVSRSVLPWWYRFHNWNGGLLRGTISHNDDVLIYGSNGLWLTNLKSGKITDFNNGIPESADHRQIRGVTRRNEDLYAVTPYGLYALKHNKWAAINLPYEEKTERLSDIVAKGDTLIVVGRSNLYVSEDAGKDFIRKRIAPSPDQDGKVTLFRTVWMLHSGELFGFVGKIIVDFIAAILVVLCVTGIIYWLLPKTIKRRAKNGKKYSRLTLILRSNTKLHNKAGVITIVFTLFIVITGWMLRPPLMIPLALTKTSPIPGTTMDSENPWHDKLRMLRFDEDKGDWLLSTSDGFFSIANLDAIPLKLKNTPPVSVMGLNVWEKDSTGNWLCGSFSGIYRWSRNEGKSFDLNTGEIAPESSGPPFGKFAVSGYSSDFNAIIEYNDGLKSMPNEPGNNLVNSTIIPQPEEFETLPMSLWAVALEAHSGRLFIGQIATYIFIFFTGIICFWCLLSGYKSHHSKQRRKSFDKFYNLKRC